MDIVYDYYKLFYYVVKYGSFSKAATVLMRSQPNMTKMMNKLEEQLGCKLLVRTNRGVSLTAEGEKLYAHVEIAMEHILAAEAEILNLRGLNEGTVSIATTEDALYGSVLSAVSRFSQDHPSIRIKLTNQTNERALCSLGNGLSDLAVITTDEVDEGRFRVRQIKKYREILCCQSQKAKTLSSLDVNAILMMPYISLASNTYTYRFLREYLFGFGIYKETDIQVATADQILPLIKSGVGIGFVSEFMVKDALESGDVTEISLKSPPPMRKICLAEAKNGVLNPAARKIFEYLK